jgi:endoglucanase
VRRYGFNFQWMFDDSIAPVGADRPALDFLAANGFDFVRLPTNYRIWTTGFDYFRPDESVLELVDEHQRECAERGIHLSLNIHRAPGYCITSAETELHNLWTDEIAQDAFVFLWETFALRYRGVPAEMLSFDLLNEPPAIGVRGFDRDIHERLVRRTVSSIRAIDPQRPVVIDGLDGGNRAMPELTDLGLIHSGRAYEPYPVSHWGAEWWDGWREGDAPRYPGVVYHGRAWDRTDIVALYRPWREVEAAGTAVHIGEFGCYDHTPNDDALRWLGDVLGLFHEYGWGFALWNFEGPFGIIGHRRPGARFERRDGYDVDVDLLDLLVAARQPT